MNKREFIKSAAAIAGATVVSPLSATISPIETVTPSLGLSSTLVDNKPKQKVALKKELGAWNDQRGVVIN